MEIRRSKKSELETILAAELDAFSGEDEIRQLVSDLYVDESALPLISLLAVEGSKAVGHVYFSHAKLHGATATARCMILAPLAVIKERQKKGVGKKLIQTGLAQAKAQGIELVFVLGHPAYYPRSGFVPAGQFGFDAPYPIEEKNADAWMVQELVEGAIARVGGGKVICAESMMKPEYWRE